MKTNGSCLSLLHRIHNQCLRDDRLNYRQNILHEWGYLFVYLFVLMIFQCHNRVYNAWLGPFPMNLDQFRNHLELNYDSFGYKSYFSFRWLSFQPEYIQIEFGKDVIDSSVSNSFQYTYIQAKYGRVTYMYNRVIEPTIVTRYPRLYLKFGSYDRSEHQVYHSYQFQSFSINTLQCIVKQLGISPTEFLDWHDKSIYIKKIGDIYKPSSQLSSMTLLSKCGIIIGYFDKPMYENYFPGPYPYHQFDDQVRLFDSSCPYTPYISNVLISFFIYFLLKKFVLLFQLFVDLSNPLSLTEYPSIVEQLKKSGINSLENLDNLLLNTTAKNNHRDSLFIVRDKYLVIFMIKLDENSPKVLQQFYKNAPFMIIPIDTITNVKKDCIVLHNEYNRKYIYFPSCIKRYYAGERNWLHERLMSLNEEYRYNWEFEEFLNQDKEQQRHFAFLVAEETQYQQREYGHDLSRIFHRITSASPRFIARFRLTDPRIASDDMLYETCTICLDDFQSNQRFARWPCKARHTFHFNCMLNVLRAGNKCPLCRDLVEPADLPRIETVIPLMAQRAMATVLN